jgi:hypothetical protein
VVADGLLDGSGVIGVAVLPHPPTALQRRLLLRHWLHHHQQLLQGVVETAARGEGGDVLHLQAVLDCCQLRTHLLHRLPALPCLSPLEIGGCMRTVLSDDGIDILSDSLLELLPLRQTTC